MSYTIDLSSSQEDALQFLTEQSRIENDDDTITAAATLQGFVTAALQPTEAAIKITMDSLTTAGHALPAVVRERMTETLTAPQLALIVHLQPPVGDAEQG